MDSVRNQFTFYRSYYEALSFLSKKDQSSIILAICEYALYETEPSGLSAAGMTAFELIRPTLDSSRRKASNGKQGGSKPKANRKQTASEKEGEKEKEKEIEIEREGESQATVSFRKVYDAYPGFRAGSWEDGLAAFQQAVSCPQDVDKMILNLTAWKRSQIWANAGGQYIPWLSNWIKNGTWRAAPPPAQSDGYGYSADGNRELDSEELAAIRRMMADDSV